MKKNVLLIATALFVFFQLQSCKKDNLSGPEIQTLSATALAPNAATFTGSIVNKGNFNPFDYGFIYSLTSDVSEGKGTKISLGKNIPQGEFTKEVRNLSTSSPYYSPIVYVRAYITDEKGTALGKLIQITLPSQQAGNITPTSGKSGDLVKISGKFYAESDSSVTVMFHNTKAKVISVSDTEIIAEVPQGIPAPNGYGLNVEVIIAGQRVSTSNGFTILANVKDFSPKSGPIGTYIAFSGDNLSDPYSYSNYINLFFGEHPVNPQYSGTLFIFAPSTDKVTSKISVMVDNKKIDLPGEFTILPPEITVMSTEVTLPGGSFYISGPNLPPYDTTPVTAKIGSTSAEINFNYNGGYDIIVPENLAAGDYTVSITFPPHTITTPKKLKVLPYTFTDFSPVSGGPGKEVNITGNFIPGALYTVYFGDVAIYGNPTSTTNLRVEVPGGINEGNVKIYLAVGGKKLTIAKDFKIVGPSITSFSPTSGNAGTVVTIKGDGFAKNYGAYVKFGTIEAPISSITENTITVAVPSNLNPGTMKLTVMTNGQTVTSSNNFTVTN
ncbi:IPT/TIG domain-containing protein [Pedobacter foliorum]|uniref:IPT/TIG domain-containing protein n=1 Tax=Pedobacter foliorum TaxID=2739058 RepID=UPI00156314CA|nr:IPT/TIG domain-containing protein [Pedobacter foliorum]NRF37885.1 IPT/TIG domain-containing protein [Pedobacter foliorum]